MSHATTIVVLNSGVVPVFPAKTPLYFFTLISPLKVLAFPPARKRFVDSIFHSAFLFVALRVYFAVPAIRRISLFLKASFAIRTISFAVE